MFVTTLTLAMLSAPHGALAAQQHHYTPGQCTFATLTEVDRRRFQSRYRRRVRVDGQAFADQWLRENACPTPEMAAAREIHRRGPVGPDGQPCRNVRTVMRPVSSGGSMTMIPVCDD